MTVQEAYELYQSHDHWYGTLSAGPNAWSGVVESIKPDTTRFLYLVTFRNADGEAVKFYMSSLDKYSSAGIENGTLDIISNQPRVHHLGLRPFKFLGLNTKVTVDT